MLFLIDIITFFLMIIMSMLGFIYDSESCWKIAMDCLILQTIIRLKELIK